MKHWRDQKGKRWYRSEHIRVTRLFRYHVNTQSNPRGRIHRELCVFCPVNAQTTLSQFHRVDYAKPFLGTWVCVSCHRKIELGSIIVTAHKLFDYTQLVAPLLRPKTSLAMRAFHSIREKPTGSTPF